MYALIETGGKQYRVEQGYTIFIEKLDLEEGSTVVFDKVLMVKQEEKVMVGKPLLDEAKVSGVVVKHGRGKKIVVFKYKPKKKYRRKQGHRQSFTRVLIEKIEA